MKLNRCMKLNMMKMFAACAMVFPTSAAVPSGNVHPLLVGIVETCESGGESDKVAVGAAYAEAVAIGGHLPVVISRYGTEVQIEALLARIDMLLLAGGGDIDPKRYGESAHPAVAKVNPVRDEFEFRILAVAKKLRLPVVGICRGCQMLNVFNGGTLWQDLPSEFPSDNVQHRNVRHPIAIEPGSRLAKAIGTTSAVVNSTHHQAVKRLAPGFRVVAKSPEGVVEAIEAEDYPAIGVQFHPERLAAKEKDETFKTFFRNLHLLFKDGAGAGPCAVQERQSARQGENQ